MSDTNEWEHGTSTAVTVHIKCDSTVSVSDHHPGQDLVAVQLVLNGHRRAGSHGSAGHVTLQGTLADLERILREGLRELYAASVGRVGGDLQDEINRQGLATAREALNAEAVA